MHDFHLPEEFEWDEGNAYKNEQKHGLGQFEIEQVFFNLPVLIKQDIKHMSLSEKRFHLLGRTDADKLLFVAFTIRKKKIRVISARSQSKFERDLFKRIPT